MLVYSLRESLIKPTGNRLSEWRVKPAALAIVLEIGHEKPPFNRPLVRYWALQACEHPLL